MQEKIGKIVCVTWRDSCSPARTWHNKAIGEDYGAAKCKSVGWLLRIDEDNLVLAASVHDDQVGGVSAIPRQVVTHVRILK